jgi:hypothetical protein
MNKLPKKELKKSKTVSKKVKKSSKRRTSTKSKKPTTYTTWENSLRSNVKFKSQRINKSRKPTKSVKSKKAKTVKKKMKTRKTKSSKLKAKKTKTKKKTKKKKKKRKVNSSVISDLSSIIENNIQEKISSLKIEDHKLKNQPLQAQKAFNFVYQGKSLEGNEMDSYQPIPNPFEAKMMKLPTNSGQFAKNNIFGNSKIANLNHGK